MLQAGVHFGHQTHRWNPKMRKYIFAERGGIYLIDLQKTLQKLQEAREVIQDKMDQGESILFVCTKPQLADLVRKEAERCDAFHVTERWVGGMLTNWQTIKGNIDRLKDLERGLEEGAYDHYTKKEQLLLDRERQKLERYLAGIKQMTDLPGVVYIVDAKKEEIAVKEANRLDIPVVAIADTNADPDMIDVPIPGNDDAISSVSVVTKAIADTVQAARGEAPAAAAAEGEVYTYSSDAGQTTETAGADEERSRPKRKPRPEVIAQRRQEAEQAGEGEELDEEARGEAAEAEAELDAEPATEAPDADREPEASAEEDEDGEAAEGGQEEKEEVASS
ncbi:MAG: 30S ribosomal protein S2 [Gemmatimonadota bacterium]